MHQLMCMHIFLYKRPFLLPLPKLTSITMGSNIPRNNSLACRLCGQVFPNIGSLVSHVESHTFPANFDIRKLNYTNSQIELTRNAIFPNFFMNTPQQQSLAIPQPRTSQILNNDLHVDVSSLPISQENDMQISLIDGTKPFINQLDKPINNVFGNSANINDHTLSLELGL